MECAPPGHPYHPLACYWLAKVLYETTPCFTEEIIQLFKTALEGGISNAAKYIMSVRSSLEGTACFVKWCNPREFIQIAMDYPQNLKEHVDTLTKDLTDTVLHHTLSQMLFYEVRLRTEAGNLVTTGTHSFEFCRLICELFCAKDNEINPILKEIEANSAGFSVAYEKPSILMDTLSRYALCMRGKPTAEALQYLLTSSSYTAAFCAADILRKSDDKQDRKQCKKLYEKAFEIIHGYQYLADCYLQDGKIKKALKVYRLALRRMNRFLKGDSHFFEYKHTEQALLALHFGIPEDIAFELAYEELEAGDLHCRFFQDQIELLEEAWEEQKKNEPAPLPPITIHPDPDSESDSAYVDARTSQHEDSSGEDGYITAPEFADSNVPEGFTPVTKRKKKRKKKATPSARAIISEAGTLAEKKKYTEAEAKLETTSPKKQSIEWYMKEQKKCWIRHLQVNDPEYIRKTAKEELAATALKKELTDKSKSRATYLINSLADMVASPAFTGTKKGTVVINLSLCMDFAARLETTNPKLRSQYGGLYSLLGHLETDYRNNTKDSKERKAHMDLGTEYYKLANHIRGRVDTDEAEPE